MKKIITARLSLLFALLFLVSFRIQAFACVQSHDSVNVRVHYETPGNTDVSITLSNLKLATGTPNEFCSCGINGVTQAFSQILYVAFVDSGTTNPYPGFDVWDPSANAANAWNGVVASGSWNAFVSHVNVGGLLFNHPVELIVRARLQPGYYYTNVDSMLYISQLASDAWDNTNQVLGNMHQDVSGLLYNHVLIPEGPGSMYFANLDAALMTSSKPQQPQYQLDIFPVPAKDRLYVALRDPLNVVRAIEVYDTQGRQIIQVTDLKSHQEIIDVAAYPPGVYFLKIQTIAGLQTRKFLKSN